MSSDEEKWLRFWAGLTMIAGILLALVAFEVMVVGLG